jgi:chromate reductase, NAD(P)H dehydrogenase (quinone)
MIQYRIAVVVGSLRRDSWNRKLANAIATLAQPEFAFEQVPIGDLPLYDQDDDAHQAESVNRLKEEIRAARGLLFVTPEYNRSVPRVLKNAIDHASRPLMARAPGPANPPASWAYQSGPWACSCRPEGRRSNAP